MNSLLTHAVVRQLDVSLVIQEDIVQFQISVNYSALVKIVERETNFCAVKTRVLLWQSSLTLHVEHQVSSADKLNHKEQPAWSLEAGMKTRQEGMIGRCFKHMFLCLHPVDVFIVSD